MGFIVNDDGYVNWLGSGASLSTCFWGHELGIGSDLVDFTFTGEVKADDATVLSLVLQFKRCLPQPDKDGFDDAWYSEDEARLAIKEQFPTFRRHWAWFALRDLRKAVQERRVSFYAKRSEGAVKR